MKSISTIIASILMLLIVLTLAGTAYLYISGALTGKTSTAFEIMDSYQDTITIRNSGTGPITSFRSVKIDNNDAVYLVTKQDDSLVGYWKMDETTRTNLLLWSEAFDNSVWAKGTLTVTADNTIAPDGTTTADLLTPNAGATDAYMYQYFTPLSTGSHTFSVWLKSATGSNVAVNIYVQRSSGGIPGILAVTITPEWQRFTLTFNPLDTTTHHVDFGFGYTWVAGENIYAWGAQMEEAPEAGTYTKTINSPAGGSATAIDSSNKGNTGTLLPSGSEPRWVAGKWGNALRFDGSNDYVDVGSGASLEPANAITVEIWFKANYFAPVSWTTLIWKGGLWAGTEKGYALMLGPNYLSWYIGNAASNVVSVASPALSTGQWYHAVGTFNGFTMRLYLDGIEVGTPASQTDIGNQDIPLGIGISAPGSLYFNGLVDEVRIYNRALSEQEIKSNYNIGSQINAGEAATIKIYNTLSKGTHTVRMCTSSMCNVGYLTTT